MRDDQLHAALLAELRSQPVARPWWRDAALVVGVNALITTVALAALTWTSQQHGSEVLRWAGVAMLTVLLVVGGVAAIRPGGRSLQLSVVGLGAACVGVLLAAVSGRGVGVSLMGGAGCGVTVVLLSLLPVGATLVVLSRFAFQPLRAVVAGLSAGAGGVLVVELHCPNGEGAHALAFHLVPWFAVAVGLLLLRAKWRTRSFVP